MYPFNEVIMTNNIIRPRWCFYQLKLLVFNYISAFTTILCWKVLNCEYIVFSYQDTKSQSVCVRYEIQCIEARRNIYASVYWLSMGSGHALLPVRGQAITYSNVDLTAIGSPRNGGRFVSGWINSSLSYMDHWWLLVDVMQIPYFMCSWLYGGFSTLQWRNNEQNGVPNQRCLYRLLKRLLKHRSKKTRKPRVTGLCEGIHRWPVDSPHKGPVKRKMLPFDDVIMN